MRILYLDCFSGISGDMLLGALIDLGVPIETLQQEIESLGLTGFSIEAIADSKQHLHGTRFFVHIHPEAHGRQHPSDEHGHHHDHPHESGHSHPGGGGEHEHAHPHRTLADIEKMIRSSAFSSWTKDKAIAVFRRIAVAEGKIHDRPAEEVTFHEVGALDSIVDILLGCRAIELLNIDRVLASIPVAGSGFVECQHGEYPVPSTATLEILKGIPLRQSEHPFELITPTGAGFLAEFVEEFGPFPAMVIEQIGYGIGLRSHHRRPNALRALLGQTFSPAPGCDEFDTDWVAVLETQVDDLSPELLAPLIDSVLTAGALDATITPVQMKKQRSGHLVSVYCHPQLQEKISALILRETSAFGLRISCAKRMKLDRFSVDVPTSFGEIPVKIGVFGNLIETVSPEFEPCHRLAGDHDVPLKAVFQSAVAAAHSQGLVPGRTWEPPKP
jgi:uncharacterized protein (TIGR00299 family) protein